MKICSNYPVSRKPVRGFTLVELLVVISIIALLLAILMPSLQKARRQAQAMICMARLNQMSLASIMYSEEYDGKLPPLLVGWNGINHNVSWLRYIVPYIKLDKKLSTGDNGTFLYNDAPGPKANREGMKSVLVCPEAVKLCKLELSSPTYGRNGFGVELDIPLKLADCRNPSSTIFIADALVADIVPFELCNVYPVIGPSTMSSGSWGNVTRRGTFEEMGYSQGYHPAPHDNDSIGISWHDGHVSRHPKMKYADYETTPSAWNFK
jgi:prepilin-type N-terminal cleavage/methylation domain-containing protein